MSVSHGHTTIGGIDGGCGEDKKKEIVSHQCSLIDRQWRGLTIDINVRSRDCHATDALEL